MGKVRTITGMLGDITGTWVSYEDFEKLEAQLEDAKSFAKRCANSPIGQIIKQLDAVRDLPDDWHTWAAKAKTKDAKRAAECVTQCADELQVALNGEDDVDV